MWTTGATVDENALVEAIEQKRIRKAYIDVFEHEPLTKESSWWDHSNISLNISYFNGDDAVEAVECFVETLQKVEQANCLLTC